MKNVTISISESVEAFARTAAAKKRLSLSRFISQLLEDLESRERAKTDILRDYLAEEPFLETNGKTFTRDELYDRKVLR